MSTTKELAKLLGHLEIINISNRSNHVTKQTFKYLLVLDFESTCWDKFDKDRGVPEIIEFPVLLYNIERNIIVEEFSQYVMPIEKPKLSEFCKSFTGITQNVANNGVPLGTCLMLFMNWLNKQIKSYDLIFPNIDHGAGNNCTFLTWSNWDLNVCLKNECKRKRIKVPNIFNSWIDIKASYKQHYGRKPNGLSGALTELGLKFIGREHCGLDDARNTAHLTGKMISDGVLLMTNKQ